MPAYRGRLEVSGTQPVVLGGRPRLSHADGENSLRLLPWHLSLPVESTCRRTFALSLIPPVSTGRISAIEMFRLC